MCSCCVKPCSYWNMWGWQINTVCLKSYKNCHFLHGSYIFPIWFVLGGNCWVLLYQGHTKYKLCFKCNCLFLSKLKFFINRNEYLTALYMLITGQEVMYVTVVLRMLIIANIFIFWQKLCVSKPPCPLFSHTPWIYSLNMLTQAILETIAVLLSDWPTWHS